MASVFDVAQYILEKMGGLTTWKLQKLVYYSQAWSLVWDDEALFDEEIEAWANGPVVRQLYNFHRGQFRVEALMDGTSDNLSDNQRDTIDRVLDFYGKRSPQWLSDLTHMEMPWQKAREGVPDGERGDKVISKADLAEYYGSISGNG